MNLIVLTSLKAIRGCTLHFLGFHMTWVKVEAEVHPIIGLQEQTLDPTHEFRAYRVIVPLK